MSDVKKVEDDKKTERVRKVERLERAERRKRLPWRGAILIWVLAAASAVGAIVVLVKVVNYVPPDDDPPTIALKGEELVEVPLGSDDGYVDAGATAYDERDGELVVATALPEIDVWNEGEYTVKYTATDAAGNVAEALRKVKIVAPAPVEGAVYLTFDDGPSEHTARLLDVLKKYKVKATFFVIGRDLDDMIKREYDEGHAIGLHTLTHNYAYIYQNQNVFLDDLYAIQNKVKEITDYTSTLMRFPGGSSNTVSALYDGGARIMTQLVSSVQARGFAYFDWNISSGDVSGARTPEEVYNNVVSRLGPGEWVVLQHDTQGYSVDAVEQIIQYGKKNGYQFKALSQDSYGAWHWVRN